MPSSSRVIDKDKGWNAIMSALKGTPTRVQVRVGFWAGMKGGRGDKGTLIVEYATFNEYGVTAPSGEGWRIPPRPFMAQAFDTNEETYNQMLSKLFEMAQNGQIPPEAIFQRVGQQAVNDVKRSITDSKGWAAPNAPSTVARKGSSTPLIDTGAMRNAVTFEVRVGESRSGEGEAAGGMTSTLGNIASAVASSVGRAVDYVSEHGLIPMSQWERQAIDELTSRTRTGVADLGPPPAGVPG